MGLHTWPELLTQAGYQTLSVGKMHFYPWDSSEGFQHRVISEDKRHIDIEDDYHDALVVAGYKKEHAQQFNGYLENKGACINPLPDHYQPDRWVAHQAAQCIEHLQENQPFAMMIGFPGPHCPYDPPSEPVAKIDLAKMPAALPPRQHYAALVERLDNDIETILDSLKRSGFLENTIVVFSSDHGDYLGDYGLVGKTYFHEPSIRVPLIIADFRVGSVGTVNNNLVSILDLFPSILSWAGLEPPAYAAGKLLGSADSDRMIAGVTTHGMMIRSQHWKLVRYRNGSQSLYDLKNDPHELNNVISQFEDVREAHDSALTEILLDGFSQANADKTIAEAKSSAAGSFHQRGWKRNYPGAIDTRS